MPINQRTIPKRLKIKPVGELSSKELATEFRNVLGLFDPAHRNARVLNEVWQRSEIE